MTTKIEWTDRTWNPTTGCDKVSPGCKNCYAERMSNRLQKMGVTKYRNNFKVTLHPETLDDPRKWRKPSKVFVNSMSDLFHNDVPLWFIFDVFDVMRQCPQHTFQILTKRSERLLDASQLIGWPDNVWMGVSVEDERRKNRIDDLRKVPAKVRFLSCEPLLGSLTESSLDLTGIDQVIVGGESGPGSRMMNSIWVYQIKHACKRQDVAFFFKQWGGVNKAKTGRLLDGKTYSEFPNAVNI